MKIAIPNQTDDNETRVALVPQVVKRLVDAGVSVVVEADAGRRAAALDADYRQAGATVVASDGDAPAGIWAEADAVLTVRPPSVAQVSVMKAGAMLAGVLAPLVHADLVRTLAERGVTSFAMEFVPRISRAQSMDVLSSQANIGGYKAVVMAAERAPKMFPMMITAAGTIAPARVFILGAGVAGLQAIATAKRLGAVVEAFDVRPATKEQVQSLGGRFVELPLQTADAETTGGYAKEQSDEQRKQQAELMAKHVTGADAVIATAAVFGKAPPMLIPADVVKQMRPGSVIVDLAADPAHGRGNCESTRPGEQYTTDNDVTIVGTLNLPALVPVHASQVYANNMHAFLKELLKEGELTLNLDDEIQKGACITHAGEVRNAMVKETQNK
ncbi:MAG: Re/Si-specific NAD(P)(+) transhydrogenase subunit alpha [Phycisphaeraceae bacterium]